MKAIVYTKYGPAEVLHLQDVEKPAPKDNEVPAKIYATTVAKGDRGWRAYPGSNGFLEPRHPILGQDLAGVFGFSQIIWFVWLGIGLLRSDPGKLAWKPNEFAQQGRS